jgi:hypothetical protein
MISLNLSLLENGARFQSLCFRVAKKEFPNCIPVAIGSRDNGIDILQFNDGTNKDIVWQCKFTKANSLSSLKPKIISSFKSLNRHQIINKWILCISKEATMKFIEWISETIKDYPFIKSFEIWDETIILEKLENYPDIVEIFFYRNFRELEKFFCTAELELMNIKIGKKRSWVDNDSEVLQYSRKHNDESDMIIDIIIKNKGSVEVMLSELSAQVYEVNRILRGIPESLLLPKITYEISIHQGVEGKYRKRLEPPFLIKPKTHERFKIKLRNVGYAWVGKVKISIKYNKDKILNCPTILLKA